MARGLFPTRSRAQAAVMAGLVRSTAGAVDKPGTGVSDDAVVAVEEAREFVSRGGLKLDGALDAPRPRRVGRIGARPGRLDGWASPTACCAAAPGA